MYAIVGAAGNTGRPVAETLLKHGEQVRVIGRRREHLQPLIDSGADACITDVTDRTVLAHAFQGTKGVYLMIPTNPSSPNYREEQDRTVASLAYAVATAKVPYAVTLSSVGADKAYGTGPVVGLHRLEQALNEIPSLNVLHLRAGYFMENMLAQVHVVSAMTATAGMFYPDLPIAMIATRDIAAVAAKALLVCNFQGSTTCELLGERDLTMNEATTVIGRAIGRPDLPYSPAPESEFKTALTHLGLSENMAELITEMCAAMNSGHMKPLELRSPANTTPTAFETFVAETWMPQWRAAIGAQEGSQAEQK